LIIIILHENVLFAIHCQDGTAIHVTRIFVIFIFMMKNTKNYAVFSNLRSSKLLKDF
jgi:hypothetical protein